MKNYAVLLAPEFRLQATLRYAPNLLTSPVALLELQGTKLRVSELNSRARTYEVHEGLTASQALARCPELNLIRPNHGHERSAQEALLQMAERLSPYLESTGPGVVTIELPAERIFQETDFLDALIVPARSFGLEIQAGIAGTPDFALLAARFAAPVRIVSEATAFLAPLPIEALQPGEELKGILESWGIRTIGQFVALPAAALTERLGPEAARLRELAQGGRVRPLQLIKPQEFFAEEADLESPIEMLEPLLFLLRRFLEKIMARLAQIHLVSGKLRLKLHFEYGEPYQRVFTIPQPTREVELLFRMLHTHLENFVSEWPIVRLELAAKPVRPNAEQFDLLEKGFRDPHQFAETLARLQALLGTEQVGTPEIESSHHPDAFHLQPYDCASVSALKENEELIGIPWLRFCPPLPANIILNGGLPAFLYSPRSNGPIKEARGPWRLEGNWWEERHWSRKEWDIATDDGIYRLVHTGDGWFLDGIYA